MVDNILLSRMNEEWRQPPEYHPYQVSSWGRIKGKTGKVLSANPALEGYAVASLCLDGQPKTVLQHVVVARTFLPNPGNKPCVKHVNGIRLDNRVENLVWADSRAKRVSQSTLRGDPVRVWESLTRAAENVGVSISGISSCCTGRQRTAGGFRWAYYEEPSEPPAANEGRPLWAELGLGDSPATTDTDGDPEFDRDGGPATADVDGDSLRLP